MGKALTLRMSKMAASTRPTSSGVTSGRLRRCRNLALCRGTRGAESWGMGVGEHNQMGVITCPSVHLALASPIEARVIPLLLEARPSAPDVSVCARRQHMHATLQLPVL